ncbi:Lrp/AsnC family transcriptional regulator, partial [Streptococcus pseudopneumoniae]|uniref:Lrp/AsnC family transcriptional regulator n=1 Tax=Streptococcus pseudopneumoniae TaxID=257758 RepID=UPI00110C21A9
MDDTDFQILAALKRDPLASHAELARDVGLTAPAVRARVTRLQEAGILVGFGGLPAAEVFGRVPRIFPFPEPRVEAEDLDAIVAVDPVIWVSLKHDGAITAELYLEEETDTPPTELVDL